MFGSFEARDLAKNAFDESVDFRNRDRSDRLFALETQLAGLDFSRRNSSSPGAFDELDAENARLRQKHNI